MEKILQILQFQFEGLVDLEIPILSIYISQSRIAPFESFKVNGQNNYNNYHNMQMVAALVAGGNLVGATWRRFQTHSVNN